MYFILYVFCKYIFIYIGPVHHLHIISTVTRFTTAEITGLFFLKKKKNQFHCDTEHLPQHTLMTHTYKDCSGYFSRNFWAATTSHSMKSSSHWQAYHSSCRTTSSGTNYKWEEFLCLIKSFMIPDVFNSNI